MITFITKVQAFMANDVTIIKYNKPTRFIPISCKTSFLDTMYELELRNKIQ